MNIEIIRTMISEKKIKWSSHCLERMGERNISIADVKTCLENGEIIEDYPDDYPFPSCLIFGYNLEHQVIHVVVGSDSQKIYIITAYIPSTKKFEDDLRTRRK